MKQLLLCFFSTIVFFSAHSQVNFRLKSGLNISTTRDLIAYPKNRLGWYGGLAADIPFNARLSVQPELLYSSKGYRYADLSDGKIITMKLNYLSFPALIKYSIDSKTSILGGGEFGYLINAVNQSKSFRDDATSSFPRRLEAGLAVGIQYAIVRSIGIDVRYVYGLKSFYQTDVVGIRRSDSWAANRTFQIGIQYRLSK